MSFNSVFDKAKMNEHNHTLEQLFLLLGYPAFLPIFIYLGIDQDMFIILCLITLSNSILGGVKSHILHNVYPKEYEPFSRRILLIGMAEEALMLICFFLACYGARLFGYDGESVSYGIMWVMSLAGIYNFFGNAIAIKTKRKVKKIDLVLMGLRMFRNFIHNQIVSVYNKINKSNDCDFKDRD